MSLPNRPSTCCWKKWCSTLPLPSRLARRGSGWSVIRCRTSRRSRNLLRLCTRSTMLQRLRPDSTRWREALQRTMYPVLTRLRQEGFVLPLFVTCIGRDGSMMCERYDDIEATGLEFIFETSHIEGEAFLVPIHMLVVDQ